MTQKRTERLLRETWSLTRSDIEQACLDFVLRQSGASLSGIWSTANWFADVYLDDSIDIQLNVVHEANLEDV